MLGARTLSFGTYIKRAVQDLNVFIVKLALFSRLEVKPVRLPPLFNPLLCFG